MGKRNSVFYELVELMQRLRGRGGCPWDRKQTHTSLRPFLLEETHEVLDAIQSRSSEKLRDELGDLLFQVIFHAQLAAEAGRFTIDDVIRGSLEKMRRRHPHVFGKDKLSTSRQVLENWEEIKRRERRGSGKSLLDGVPRTLPALLRAHRVQAKAARVGFTWSRVDQAWGKVSEELAELEQALAARRSARIVEELGDVFFALVNLARFAEANPEDALHQTVGKFIRRFGRVEAVSKRLQRPLSDFSLAELQALWQESKQPGRLRPAKAARPGREKSLPRRKTPGTRKNPDRPAPGLRGR